MTNITSTEYIDFVQKTTSSASSDVNVLIDRIRELEGGGVKLTHLLTFALGASAEMGECVEIIKKCLHQGKCLDEQAKTHAMKEAGDCLWYFAQFCIAMGVSFEDLMQMNYEKLISRYPEGHFSVHRSENRKEGDI